MSVESSIMSLGSKIKDFVWSKRFLKNFLILIAVYVILIFGTKWFLGFYTSHGEKIAVPNFIGKNFNTVPSRLENLDLEYEILDSIYDPKKIAGTIISQDPMPTSKTDIFVKGGRTIRFRVTKRTHLVDMPKCIDKSQRFAENILKNRGLKFKVEFRATYEAHGAVIDQLYKGKRVREKTKVPIGATITLIVGQYMDAESIVIPDLLGLTIFEAKARLLELANFNIILVCDECKSSSDSTAAFVISQSPEYIGGMVMPAGSTVTLFGSLTPPENLIDPEDDTP